MNIFPQPYKALNLTLRHVYLKQYHLGDWETHSDGVVRYRSFGNGRGKFPITAGSSQHYFLSQVRIKPFGELTRRWNRVVPFSVNIKVPG